MSKARYKAGLIGAGYISEYHIKAIRRLPDIELIGVFDIDEGQSEQIAKKFNTKVFHSLEELREGGANIIHVLTPPHTHAGLTLDALNLGCHVLVEKPLAVNVDDCYKIEESAREKGLQVCVNHSLLFDPQVRRALESVKKGRLGRVVSVDILRSSVYPPFQGGELPPHYREAGYPFRDLGIHALYLFQAFLGKIEHVEAEWKSLGGDPDLAFDEWRANVCCEKGLGQFQLSWNVNPLQSQIIIQGTGGVLRADLFLMFNAVRKSTPLPKPAERIINAFTDSVQPMIDVPLNVLRFIRGKVLPYHGLQELVAEFYRSLKEGRAVPVSVEDAIHVVRWTEEIAKSADRDFVDRIENLKVSENVPVLVTGASGSLGGAIVERLLSEGERVRIFVRRIPEMVPEGVEVVVGNLGNPEAVERAVKGAKAVIHAGAAMKGGWIEHECGTVRGTQNILEACGKFNVEKLIHISSLSVVDWAGSHNGGPVSEQTGLEPRPRERGAYTQAKLEAELMVSRYVKENKLSAVLLRPGQIFGGRIPLLTPATARHIAGRWIVLGDGKLELPLVHIDDVVDAILLSMKADLKSGEIIQLVGTESVTQNDVLQLTKEKNARIIRIPRFVVYSLGGLSQLLLKALGRKSPLSVYRLRSALPFLKFRSEKAKLLLGWNPKVRTLEEVKSRV